MLQTHDSGHCFGPGSDTLHSETMYKHLGSALVVWLGLALGPLGCTSDTTNGTPQPDAGPGGMPLPSTPSCTTAAGGGSAQVKTPTLLLTLKDRYEEAWLGSAAVADLNGVSATPYSTLLFRDATSAGANLSQYAA